MSPTKWSVCQGTVLVWHTGESGAIMGAPYTGDALRGGAKGRAQAAQPAVHAVHACTKGVSPGAWAPVRVQVPHLRLHVCCLASKCTGVHTNTHPHKPIRMQGTQEIKAASLVLVCAAVTRMRVGHAGRVLPSGQFEAGSAHTDATLEGAVLLAIVAVLLELLAAAFKEHELLECCSSAGAGAMPLLFVCCRCTSEPWGTSHTGWSQVAICRCTRRASPKGLLQQKIRLRDLCVHQIQGVGERVTSLNMQKCSLNGTNTNVAGSVVSMEEEEQR